MIKYQTLRQYFTTSDYNKYTSEVREIKIKEKGLLDRSNVFNLIKNSDLHTKLATLVTKTELKAEQDKIVKLQAFDSSYFCGKSHFEDYGMQNYLRYQLAYRYFKKIINSNHILSSK